MLRQYRLKRRAAFAYVYRKGERSFAKGIVLLSARSREGLKIGLSVSKKVGNAVVRNHAKRLLREAINPIIDAIDAHYMYVIVVKPELAGMNFAEVSHELRRAFEKAGKLQCS